MKILNTFKKFKENLEYFVKCEIKLIFAENI